MIPFLTKKDKQKLLKNGRLENDDVPPVVKLFNEQKGLIRLLYKIDPDNEDIAYALYGVKNHKAWVQQCSLSELEANKIKFQSDKKFKTSYTINTYLQASEFVEQFTEQPNILEFVKKNYKNDLQVYL